jgi:flavodoxin
MPHIVSEASFPQQSGEIAVPKKLVCYYSHTGHTQKIAELIAESVGADVERIIDEKSREGALGYLTAGRDAMLKRQSRIQPAMKDPSQYDLIILGTPIWAWNLSPPMRTYISDHKAKFNQVAFFCTEGGSGGNRAFQQMANLIGTQPVATLELTETDLKRDSYKGKLDGFVEQIAAT